MAGNAGTVTVELALDDKPYKQKLSEDLKSTEVTAKGMETVWKTLGIKSSEYYDAQRRAYQNALTLIKSSTDLNAQDRIRAEQAMNEKLKTLNDQQFGAQKSGLEMLKSHYIAFAAGAATAIAGIGKAWDLAKAGAEFKEQEGLLDNLSRKYGTSATEIVSAMAEASEGLISNADLMKIALGGISKELKPEQLIELAGAAEILGDAAGMSATEALKSLTSAMETGRTKGLLPMLGTSLDLEKVFGDLTGELTLAEKAQAIYLLAIMKAKDLQREQTFAVDGTADAMDRLTVKYENAKTAISKLAAGALADLLNSWDRYTKQADRVAVVMDEQGRITVDNTKSLKEHTEKIEEAGSAEKKMLETMKASTKARKDDKQVIKDHAVEAKKAADDQKRQIAELLSLSEKSWLEGATAREKEIEEQGKALLAEYEAEKKYAADIKKLGDESLNQTLIALEKETEEVGKAMNDQFFAEKKAAEDAEKVRLQTDSDRLKATRDLYTDLRGYETKAYDATLALIIDQAEKYKKLGIDKNIIDKWVVEENRKEFIKMAEHHDSWVVGVKAGLKEITTAQTTWGGTALELTRTFSKSAKSELSNNFFAAFTGNMDTAGINWTGMWEGMARTLSDKLAAMVVEAAAEDISLLFDAKWTVDGSAVIGMLTKLGGWVSGLFDGGDFVSDFGGGGTGDIFRAKGGDVSGGSAYWVGEKGPELLFTKGPGYVMEHNRSMSYAAQNGGYIPGREHGGGVGAPDINAFLVGKYPAIFSEMLDQAKQGKEFSYDELWMLAMDQQKHFPYKPKNLYNRLNLKSWAQDPVGSFDADVANMLVIGDNRKRINFLDECTEESTLDTGQGSEWYTVGFTSLIKAAVIAVASYVSYGIGTGPLLAGLFGAGIGLAESGGNWKAAGISGVGAAVASYASSLISPAQQIAINQIGEDAALGAAMRGGGADAMQAAYASATSAAYAELLRDTIAPGILKNVAKNALPLLLGGSNQAGKPEFDLSGSGSDNGLGAMFGSNLGAIAPRSDAFVFHAQNGLGYVPYDGMRIKAHQGEAVLSKRQAKDWRGEGGGMAPVQVNLVLNNKVLASALYQQSKAGVKIIHKRGIATS